MSKKLVFVNSGGGAASSEAMGALLEVHAAGILPNAIYGTSAGALNAFGYSMAGPKALEAAWDGIKSEGDIFDGDWWVELPWKTGIKNAGPLRKLLLNLQAQGIKDGTALNIPFFVTATQMRPPKHLVVYPSSSPLIVDMTVASASIPGYVEAYQPNASICYCDGGVLANLPIVPAAQDGADIIVCFHSCAKDQDVGDDWSPGNPLDQLIRGFEICDSKTYLDERNDFMDGITTPVPTVIDIWCQSNDIGPLQFEAPAIAKGKARGRENGKAAIPLILAALNS